VSADDNPVAKASETVPVDAVLRAEPAHPWVSRGGLKLTAALDHFNIDPAGAICLDVGASTGGFTDVLLARGASRVYAIDVGHGQLHPRLRQHPRVVSLERTDIRTLASERLAEPPALAVVDVSFISLKLVLPHLDRLLARRARLLALIKPQFESGPRGAKKGIVRDVAAQTAACGDTAECLTRLGWTVLGLFPSPILGGDGNRELFIAARSP
jgi:23S rRNA (cytidine1920-2'-O)/16S rRNA (cytidine1409-2'-O)-methyltransferase